MVILSVRGIRKHYGPDPVLDGVSFDLRAGERAALVGPNGAGKTTLLRILARCEEQDAGEVELPAGIRVGYLEQQPTFVAGRTLWDEARDAFAAELRLAAEAEQIAHQLAAATDAKERRRLGDRFDQLQQSLHHRDAYALDHKIERVLEGLGFVREVFLQPVDRLSGGQQNRLLLAKLLLAQPDLLLLDEPSNHLDMGATQWLEEYLAASNQTLLVISHDRYLLDKVATRTLELLRGEVESFAGNYTAYRRQKAERLEVQRRAYEKQQLEIAKMEDFIRRNHYGQKAAQAEDRRKKLERLVRVPPPREIVASPMRFPPANRCGDIVIRAERLAKSFARPLFRDVTLDVLRGEKWGILGPNGIGKTTLLRCLLGISPPDEGGVTLGTGVKIAYFDQLLSCLPEGTTVVEAIRPKHKEFVEQQRRDLLARFGLTGDLVFQKVESLSGGERNRAALAMLAATDANVLVLDEPTNHLDLWARDALEQAIRQFDGTVLFVSHDRYFVNQVADHLLVLEPARVWVVAGDYDTYLRLRAGSVAEQAARPIDTGRRARDAREETPARRKRRFPYRRVADLEAEIASWEQATAKLHDQLANPEVLRDGDRVRHVMAELDEVKQRLVRLYEHWEEAVELNG